MSESSTTQWDIAQPLQTYRRETPVQALLDSWRRLSPRVVLQRLRADASRAIPNEALVAAARAFIRAGLREDAWTVLQLVAERTSARTYRHMAVWGLEGARHREDVTREILQILVDCVLSTTPQNEFWECRFWTCFDRRTRTFLRDYCRGRAEETPWDEITEGALAREESGVGAGASSAGAWTDDVYARTLFERIPEPYRTAFYLKHYGGYKEESRTDEPTIATALNVSGRTVRTYLRRAEEMLAEWRAEGGDDD